MGDFYIAVDEDRERGCVAGEIGNYFAVKCHE
jgi:hypothetical protein